MIVQLGEVCIRQHFAQFVFKKSGNNNYTSLAAGQTPKFFIANQPVELGSTCLKSDRTPDDYSDIPRRIYIEIGGKKQKQISQLQFIQALPDFIDANSIAAYTYGFTLTLCTQQIPEVVAALVNQCFGFAIYQICYMQTALQHHTVYTNRG